MNNRKIKVYSTKTGKLNTISTDATFWGQLSVELEDKGWYNPSSMKAVDKDTKETFAVSSREIPDGEFTLILIPTKNDSGIDFTDEDLDEIANRIVEGIYEIVDEAKEMNKDIEGLAEEAENIASELL